MATKPGTSFGEVLKRLRVAAGLTQEALAERANLSPKTVSNLESHPDHTPRLESVTLLADALGVGAEDRARLLAAARPETLLTTPLAAGEEAAPAPTRAPASLLAEGAMTDAILVEAQPPPSSAGRLSWR